jgi:hypothetical protein
MRLKTDSEIILESFETSYGAGQFRDFGRASVTGPKLVASSPGLSRRSRSGADYRDGRDKPGHEQMGLPRVLPLLRRGCLGLATRILLAIIG